MERLIKRWEQKLKIYQSTIARLPVASRNKSFWLGKKAALEAAVVELKNLISLNFYVMRSGCWSCGKPVKYHENGKPHWHCECGAEEPANISA